MEYENVTIIVDGKSVVERRKLRPMNAFLICFDDGDKLKTDFRGTLPDAQKYYIGTVFEKRDETTHQGVSVLQLN